MRIDFQSAEEKGLKRDFGFLPNWVTNMDKGYGKPFLLRLQLYFFLSSWMSNWYQTPCMNIVSFQTLYYILLSFLLRYQIDVYINQSSLLLLIIEWVALCLRHPIIIIISLSFLRHLFMPFISSVPLIMNQYSHCLLCSFSFSCFTHCLLQVWFWIEQ